MEFGGLQSKLVFMWRNKRNDVRFPDYKNKNKRQRIEEGGVNKLFYLLKLVMRALPMFSPRVSIVCSQICLLCITLNPISIV